ncbi:hypothetical protein FACS1894211_03540 [Clostridia bacterium]|nr:hypothetical protein FACS1894211_03540 [Clostridia bacterium]
MKELRIQNGLTQREIAKLLNLSQVSYLHWEQGKTQPNLESLIILCRIFDVSAGYLIGIENYDGTKVKIE